MIDVRCDTKSLMSAEKVHSDKLISLPRDVAMQAIKNVTAKNEQEAKQSLG